MGRARSRDRGSASSSKRSRSSVAASRPSRQIFPATSPPAATLPSHCHVVLNASASVEKGDIKATLFVNNLFNEHFVSGIGDGFGSYGVHLTTQVLSRDSDRYFGLKVETKF